MKKKKEKKKVFFSTYPKGDRHFIVVVGSRWYTDPIFASAVKSKTATDTTVPRTKF